MAGGFARSGGGFTHPGASSPSATFTGAGPHIFGTLGLVYRSDLAAGSAASDHKFDTLNTRAAGILFGVYNAGVAKFYVEPNGNATTVGAIVSNLSSRSAFTASGGGATLGLGIEMAEQTPPTAAANKAILFAADNGAGKTKLMVQFGTGAAIQVGIEV